MSEQAKRTGCEVCVVLDVDTNTILKTDYWQINICNDARYVGRCFVTLKAHKESLSKLTQAEWVDFQVTLKRLEKAAMTAFGADLCNWACLMNNAFQKEPYNPHVHWHFRPRHQNPVEVGGKQYRDAEFGLHYKSSWDPAPMPRFSDAQMQEIATRYKAALE